MGLASDVITRVRDTLLDPSGNRWPDAELLRLLTDVQREVCLFYPEANTKTEKITPGATDVQLNLRTLATSPIAILRFAAAHDEKADAMGYELKVVERHVMDAMDPAWYGYRPALSDYNTKASNAQYYKAVVIDPKDPLSFWLYPRAHPDFRVYVTYTATPAAIAATSTALELGDQYIPVLHDGVCAKALIKDSIYTGAPDKAKEFQESFMQKLALATGRRGDLMPTKARAPEEH